MKCGEYTVCGSCQRTLSSLIYCLPCQLIRLNYEHTFTAGTLTIAHGMFTSNRMDSHFTEILLHKALMLCEGKWDSIRYLCSSEESLLLKYKSRVSIKLFHCSWSCNTCYMLCLICNSWIATFLWEELFFISILLEDIIKLSCWQIIASQVSDKHEKLVPRIHCSREKPCFYLQHLFSPMTPM